MGGAASKVGNAFKSVYSNVLKPIGTGIISGARTIGSGILNVGNAARSGINKVMNIVDKVPIVGGLVNRALDAPVLDGVSIRQAADVGNAALDTGNAARDAINAVSRGDLDDAVRSGESAFNRGRDTRDKFNETRDKRREILNRP